MRPRTVLLALLPVGVACVIQWLYWAHFQPYAWILFYPAVIVSAWLTGRTGGSIATVLSVVLVWALFLPAPVAAEVLQGKHLVSIAAFIGVGIAFSFVHESLLRSRAAAARAEAAATAARDDFERQVHERTAELERANASLEARVNERTAELQVAKDRAESTDRLKSEFLTHMSHELRTPLNAIIGFTGTLLLKLPGPLNAEQTRQLETVQSNARHLLALINDVLDVAKVEAGRTTVHIDTFACRSLIEEIEKSCAAAARRKGIAFEITLPEKPLLLHTDRRLLHQIVLNLVGNAIKFTDSGGVHLKVSRGDPRLGEEICIRVEDTGIGIPADQQGRLFERFAQLNTSKERAHEGTGLGLYLCKHLAELLGGRITFRSELGKGSVFALTLRATA